MCKKLLMLMMCLGVIGLLFCTLPKKEEEIHDQRSSVVRIGEEIVNVYVNGEDFTEEYKMREQMAKESVARYFDKKCSEIRFYNYCMLEMEGMTIEAEIENRQYTILLNIDGEIISVRNIPRKDACYNK